MSNSYEKCEQCGERHKQCAVSQAEALGGFIDTPHRVQKFWIPGTMPGLEWIFRGAFLHAANLRKRKNELVTIASNAIRNAALSPIERKATIKIYFSFKEPLDPPQLLEALTFSSFLLEAIVLSNIWKDELQVDVIEKKWGWETKDKPVGIYAEIIE